MFGTITTQAVLSLEDKRPVGFKLYSNLTTDLLTMVFPNQLDQGNIKIFDISGKQVIDQDYHNNTEVIMDIASFNDGVYILSIKSNGLEFAQRFVKQ